MKILSKLELVSLRNGSKSTYNPKKDKMKYLIFIIFSSALLMTSFSAISDNDDDVYWSTTDAIQAELLIRVFENDAVAIQARRRRLGQLFNEIPPKYALHFSQLLNEKKEEVSLLFNHKLATVTRNELHHLLLTLDNSQSVEAEIEQVSTAKSSSSPYEQALVEMERAVSQFSVNDPNSWRYKCWLNKLSHPNVDDRVIEWKHICNRQSIGTEAGTPFSTSCEMLSKQRYISESEMFNKIKSIEDVETLNDSRMMTSMKGHLLNHLETHVYKYNMPIPHNDVQNTVYVLDHWSSGSYNAMPDYYRYISGWIGKQRNNPLSLYSCK